MAERWVLEPDYPNGHLVPMTPVEQAQFDADQVSGAALAAAQAVTRSNQSAVSAAISSRMAALRQARVSLAAGAIFAGLSANERKVIDMLIQGDLQVSRLALQAFDSTDA